MPRALSTPDAILATLQYFSSRRCPLTPSELLQFLPAACKAPALTTLGHELNRLVEAGTIQTQFGLYGLPGAMDLDHRATLYCQSLSKWHIASQSIRRITWVPFLRMVAVTNTLALNMADQDSDIDVLIVGSAGRLWTVRWMVSAVLQVLGRRRHGRFIANRICLSFYCSDRALSLRQFFSRIDDVHYCYWVGMTAVMFTAQGSHTDKKFYRENSWIREYFPQHHWIGVTPVFAVADSGAVERVRRALEWVLSGVVGDWGERALRWIQRKKIYAHRESRVHQGGVDVMVTDDVLKFHESDSRGEHRRQWEKACAQHGVVLSNPNGQILECRKI